jgi:hypothetical protein
LIVLDTEGLRAPEISKNLEEKVKHDNEMATTVMGLCDLTLVNVMQLNDPSMVEIMGIMIWAFVKLKCFGKIEPNIMFVHQGIDCTKNPE